MRDTWPLLRTRPFPALRRESVETLQLNLGYRCNLACLHCHVNAGPARKEAMDHDTLALALEVARHLRVVCLDLTGGSPEMNPHFRWLVRKARTRGLRVIDRFNPTIAEEPGYDWVPAFLADWQVEVVASLPCHSQANVDAQRGDGVFESSIRVLKALNALGYGRGDGRLPLHLVYNPLGPSLPPAQAALEAEYKQLLGRNFGIVFDRLFVLANMPVKRFGSWLLSTGRFDAYLDTLTGAHRPENLDEVMCRRQLSVDWRGYLYDCDFNQMLDQPAGGGQPRHLRDLLHTPPPQSIAVGGHCYGCTAEQGSSCGGALHAPQAA